jgi:hypothetical protein
MEHALSTITSVASSQLRWVELRLRLPKVKLGGSLLLLAAFMDGRAVLDLARRRRWKRTRSARLLRGKVAVVTGATAGIGRGIALELGQAGATVYVTGVLKCPGYDCCLCRGILSCFEGRSTVAKTGKLEGTVEEVAQLVTPLGRLVRNNLPAD